MGLSYTKGDIYVKLFDIGLLSMYTRRRELTRQHLLKTTIHLLVQDGYDRLTVTALAHHADVGRGTFYRYFADVDAAVLAIAGVYHAELDAYVKQIMAQYESPEKEQRAWVAAFACAEQLAPLFAAVNSVRGRHLYERFQATLIQGFTESLAGGDFLYPQWMDLPLDVMATFTAGAVFAVMQRWFAGDLAYDAATMGQMVYKMLYHPQNR